MRFLRNGYNSKYVKGVEVFHFSAALGGSYLLLNRVKQNASCLRRSFVSAAGLGAPQYTLAFGSI